MFPRSRRFATGWWAKSGNSIGRPAHHPFGGCPRCDKRRIVRPLPSSVSGKRRVAPPGATARCHLCQAGRAMRVGLGRDAPLAETKHAPEEARGPDGPATISDLVNLPWQGQKDLNPRPSVLETDALPTELYPSEARQGLASKAFQRKPQAAMCCRFRADSAFPDGSIVRRRHGGSVRHGRELHTKTVNARPAKRSPRSMDGRGDFGLRRQPRLGPSSVRPASGCRCCTSSRGH